MIISRKHRYIFFPIPKTGTHSVRQALRESMGEDDLEQVGLFVQKRFPFPEFADITHGHISAREIRPVLGDEVFDDYLKFTFVRNPFDRFVSYCAFMSRGTPHFETSPTAYMKHIIREMRPVNHLLYLPQYSFVVDAEGRLTTDFIGRNETMQASYDQLCQRLGIASRTLDKVNSSKHRPWQEYYDRDLIGWVSELYQKDLEMFDYRFE
ncbi:MAG TPA: sulfotransferase family 2 domain-containing protein [Arenimonas sp.]|uniref:sulfotransferase family 2 domain-containing protein n=1 Tax=Arenimonas sp. TaxID=1872635 RepID=UPI002B5F59D5|nr:sulfotransferase family 2 domain-containing protein [Arenimonas sp.]HMB56107.1 sulfotransferase family 2 domain-containing protein [Arenimonas sp.]